MDQKEQRELLFMLTNVAEAIIKTLKYKKSNTLNLSGDKLINLGEIIKISNEILNKNSKVIEKK